MKKIQLTQGKFAIVDDVDFAKANKYKWYATKSSYNWYAARGNRVNGQVKTIYMHRFIMNCPTGMEVDHKNTNSLDNRRENLRNCTRKENLQNRSYKTRG